MRNIVRPPWFGIGLVLLPCLCLPASNAPIRLELTFVESSPVTTISVGGRSVQAIVDTSAGDADGELTLTREVIANAGGVHLGNAVMIDESGRRYIRPRFRIPHAIIGGHSFHDAKAVEALADAVEKSPVPNVIGKYFLSRYFVVIDFATRTISLWPSETTDPQGIDCGRTRVPMERTREARLAVSAFATPAARLRLSWSTSASTSMLAESTVQRLKLETQTHGPNSPGFFRSPTLSAAGRNVGPLEFVVLPMQLPAEVDGMIGANFFREHVVCLDYERREVRMR